VATGARDRLAEPSAEPDFVLTSGGQRGTPCQQCWIYGHATAPPSSLELSAMVTRGRSRDPLAALSGAEERVEPERGGSGITMRSAPVSTSLPDARIGSPPDLSPSCRLVLSRAIWVLLPDQTIATQHDHHRTERSRQFELILGRGSKANPQQAGAGWILFLLVVLLAKGRLQAEAEAVRRHYHPKPTSPGRNSFSATDGEHRTDSGASDRARGVPETLLEGSRRGWRPVSANTKPSKGVTGKSQPPPTTSIRPGVAFRWKVPV
jgi:hypothetical protein